MPKDDVLANLDVETEVDRIDVKAVAVLNRSEIEAQLDAAHKYPRKLKAFADNALSMATINEEVAQSCIYALPRDGKTIAGPSVRLAEICASAWGNLHYGGRVVDEEERVVVAQGICWDLERNVRVTIETRRRIVDKKGKRFNDDMVTMTGNAASSIALRNAIFRVVPRAYVDAIYEKVRAVAVGDQKTLEYRKAAVLANFAKLGVTAERVLAKIERVAVVDITIDDLEVLVGIGTALRQGDRPIEFFFPTPGAKASEETKSLEAEIRDGGKPKEEPPATAETTSKTEPKKASKAKDDPKATTEAKKADAKPDHGFGGPRPETPTHDGREPPPGALKTDREPGQEG
jgi:hypothetical protein